MAKRRPLISSIDPREIGVCLRCGYDITGVTGDVCPECGGGVDLWSRWKSPAYWKTACIFVAPPLVFAIALWMLPASWRGFAKPTAPGPLQIAGLAVPTVLWLALVGGVAFVNTLSEYPKGIAKAALRRLALHRLAPDALLVVATAAAGSIAFRTWYTVALGHTP